MGCRLEGRDAWIALVATFLAFVLMCIPDGSFGIWYDYLTVMYNTSRTGAGWALSLYWTCIYLSGLLFSPLIDMYGCRVQCAISGLLYTIGMSLASITTTLPGLYLTYGVIAGLGCGGLYLSCSTVIQQQFTHNRGFANGITSLGFSVGAVIHPLHTLYFMEVYGVRGSFLIHGAIVSHVILCAFALKTPKVYIQSPEHLMVDKQNIVDVAELQDGYVFDEIIVESEEGLKMSSVDDVQKSSPEEYQLQSNDYDIRKKTSAEDVHTKSLDAIDETMEHVMERSHEVEDIPALLDSEDTGSCLNERTKVELKRDRTEVPEKVGLLENSVHADETRTSPDKATIDLDKHGSSDKTKPVKHGGKCFVFKQRLKNYVVGILDFSLLKNAPFVLATFHFFMLWMARLSIMAQMVSCAIYRDIDREKAAYLISISGFGNMVMRIICSIVMNFQWMDPVLFSCLSAVLVTVSGFMAAYSHTYTMFSITMVIMGVSEAIAMANLPQLLVSILGVSRYPRGYALLSTFMIPVPLGAAPLSGWLVDMTGAYYLAFLVIGIEGAISTVLAVVVFLLIRKQKKGPEREEKKMKMKSQDECSEKDIVHTAIA